MIRTYIYGRSVMSLIDTGASRSVISHKLVNTLRCKISPLEEGDSTSFLSADGKAVKVIGKVTLPVNLNGLTISVEMFVIAQLTKEILFGIDFLESTRAQIDCANRTITFFDSLVGVSILTPHKMAQNLACLSFDCVLPPRTEALVELHVLRPSFNKCNFNGDCLLQPLPVEQKQRHLICRSVVIPVFGNVICRILNPTDQYVSLNKGKPVAQLDMLGADSIIDLNHATHCEVVNHLSDTHTDLTGDTFTEDIHVSHPDEVIDQQTVKNVLQELGIKIENDKLTLAQRTQLENLIAKYRHVFAKELTEMTGTDIHMHHIETYDETPIMQRPYRASPQVKKEIARQISELLKSGIIEPSTSLWGSPCLLVKKPHSNDFRLCGDFRKLNAVTKPIFFPLPTLPDIFESVGDMAPSWFSVVDLKQSFLQLPLSPESRPKTTIRTPEASFQYRFVPYGLRNASFALQSLMVKVFQGLTFDYLICYIDDLLIFSKTFEDHMLHLESVLQRLDNAKLKLNPLKCTFAVDSLNFIGHTISSEGIKTSPDKVAVIKTYPVPVDIPTLRSYLGLVGYYRRFVKNFSIIASCLYDLLKKDVKFVWNDQHQKAFETLRDNLCADPILGFPDLNKEFIVTVDSSTKAVGFVLSQVNEDGVEHPIAYSGHTLNPQQQKWGITEIECLGLISAVKEFHPYLTNQKFKIYTDHISLKWLDGIKHKTGRLYRWSLLLSPYNYEIIHRPGKALPHVDSLSRRQYPSGSELPPNDEINEEVCNLSSSATSAATNDTVKREQTQTDKLNNLAEKLIISAHEVINNETDNTTKDDETSQYIEYTFEYDEDLPVLHSLSSINESEQLMPLANLSELQRECKDLGRIIDYIETGDLPENDKLARKTVFEADSYYMKDNILHHQIIQKGKNMAELSPLTKQVAVPIVLRHETMCNYHDDQAHNGFDRMYASMRQKLYWNCMYTDVREFVKTCTICQKSKRDYHPQRVPLKCQSIDDLFCRYHIDILDMKAVSNGCRYLLVVIESLSRFPEAFPLRSQSAADIADALYRNIICRYGVFDKLTMDRAGAHTGEIMKNLCKLMSVNRVFTSAYHPRANGILERINQTLLTSLKCHLEDKEENWVNYLDTVLFAYRATVSTSSTQFSPFFVLYGRNMLLPVDQALQRDIFTNKSKDAKTHIEKLLPKVELMREIAQKNVKEAQEKYSERYNRNTFPPTLKPGMLVWMKSPYTKPFHSNKLACHWSGPYLITSQSSATNYTLRHALTNKVLGYSVHAAKLKRCYDNRDELLFRNPPLQVDDEAVETNETSDENETHVTKSQKNSDEYFLVKEITGMKMINRVRHFRVVWEDAMSPPSWIPENDVSEFLKRQYFVKYTQQGKLRKQQKLKRRK